MKNLVQKNLPSSELGSVIELLKSGEFNKNSDANIKLCLNSLQQSLGTNFASENPNIKESRLEFVETSKLLLEKIEESKLLLKKDETAHKSLFLGKINDYKKTLKKHYRDFSTKFFNDINIFHKDFDYFSKAEKAKYEVGEFIFYNSFKSLISNSDRIESLLKKNIKTVHLLGSANDYSKIDETLKFFETNSDIISKLHDGYKEKNIFMFFASKAPNETFEEKLKYILACKEGFREFLTLSEKNKNLNEISKFISNSKLTINQTFNFLSKSTKNLQHLKPGEIKKYWQIMSKCKFDDHDKLIQADSLLKDRLKDIREIKDYNMSAKDLTPELADLISNNPIEVSHSVLNWLQSAPAIFRRNHLKVDTVLQFANFCTKPSDWVKTFFNHINKDPKSMDNPSIYLEINSQVFQGDASIASASPSSTRLSPTRLSPPILLPDNYDSSLDDHNYLVVKWKDQENSKRKRSEELDPIEGEGGPSSRTKASFAEALGGKESKTRSV